MRVAITGATGFVGGPCTRALRAAGHEVVHLVRPKPGRSPSAPEAGVVARSYEPLDVASTRAALEGAEAVVNLAGRPVLAGRWTDEVRAAIRESRIDTTRVLVEAMAGLDPRPRVLVSASGTGYYGARPPEETCTEASAAGDDFLARVCVDWEAAAAGAEQHGVRVVLLRTGIVLGRGGALAQMETPFKWFVGGRIGSGRQVMPWIHMRDMCRLIVFGVEHESLAGPVNATAPNPVSNREFTKALARALHRPAIFPVPGFVLRLRFGDGARVVTTGQRVLPAAAEAAGFAFEHPDLDGALADIYAD